MSKGNRNSKRGGLSYNDPINKIRRLNAKRNNPNADTSSLEQQIDHLVYELYGLTEEEIRIVEESQKK